MTPKHQQQVCYAIGAIIGIMVFGFIVSCKEKKFNNNISASDNAVIIINQSEQIDDTLTDSTIKIKYLQLLDTINIDSRSGNENVDSMYIIKKKLK